MIQRLRASAAGLARAAGATSMGLGRGATRSERAFDSAHHPRGHDPSGAVSLAVDAVSAG